MNTIVRFVMDLVLPPRCLACGDMVAEPDSLCGACFTETPFIAAPVCDTCGAPKDAQADIGPRCQECARHVFAYGRARAALGYDGLARKLVLGFKHGDRTGNAPGFARWMARAGADVLADADVLIPVPLHRWRLAQRTFNQSALLVRQLGRQTGMPVLANGLVRHRQTPVQGTLSRAQRRRNVADAFRVPRPERIEGRAIVLVDDVLTTGATAHACAAALQEAGAASVDVLTLARVPAPYGDRT